MLANRLSSRWFRACPRATMEPLARPVRHYACIYQENYPQVTKEKKRQQEHSTACKQLHEKPEVRLKQSPVSPETPPLRSVRRGRGGASGGVIAEKSLLKSKKSCHVLHYECNIYPSMIYRKVLTLSNVQYATHKHLHQCVRACALPPHRRRRPTVHYRNISGKHNYTST